MFQHTAARRRLVFRRHGRVQAAGFNTQPPEGGCHIAQTPMQPDAVSTHSHPKAAAPIRFASSGATPFQHTATRRRLGSASNNLETKFKVSTHSRLKAAGFDGQITECLTCVSTHSRLKAAGLTVALTLFLDGVSTHSRLKAAGCIRADNANRRCVSTHSRLKAAGRTLDYVRRAVKVSTHSRLKAAGGVVNWGSFEIAVSTHSRLKAAGC